MKRERLLDSSGRTVSVRAARQTQRAQKQCDAWNDTNPIGMQVTVLLDDGTQVNTRTVSIAQVLSGHSAVIWLQGIRGCYLLDRVKPRSAESIRASDELSGMKNLPQSEETK